LEEIVFPQQQQPCKERFVSFGSGSRRAYSGRGGCVGTAGKVGAGAAWACEGGGTGSPTLASIFSCASLFSVRSTKHSRIRVE